MTETIYTANVANLADPQGAADFSFDRIPGSKGKGFDKAVWIVNNGLAWKLPDPQDGSGKLGGVETILAGEHNDSVVADAILMEVERTKLILYTHDIHLVPIESALGSKYTFEDLC